MFIHIYLYFRNTPIKESHNTHTNDHVKLECVGWANKGVQGTGGARLLNVDFLNHVNKLSKIK